MNHDEDKSAKVVEDDGVCMLRFKGAQTLLFPMLARANKYAKPDEVVPVPSEIKHKFLARGDFEAVDDGDAKPKAAKKAARKSAPSNKGE